MISVVLSYNASRAHLTDICNNNK